MLLISTQKPLKLIYPPSNNIEDKVASGMTGEMVAAISSCESDPTESRARISQPPISQRLRSKGFYYAGTIISLVFVWTVNLNISLI